MKNIKSYISAFALAIGLSFSSCVNDLDVTPIDPNLDTADKVFSTADDFKSFLAECYAGFATSSYKGPNGEANMDGIDGGGILATLSNN